MTSDAEDFYDNWDSYDGLVGALNELGMAKHAGHDLTWYYETLENEAGKFIEDLHRYSRENGK